MEFTINDKSYIFRFLNYLSSSKLSDGVKEIQKTVSEWNEGGGSILAEGLEDEIVTVRLYSEPPNGETFNEDSFVKELTFKGDTNGADYHSATKGYYDKYSGSTIGDGFEIFKQLEPKMSVKFRDYTVLKLKYDLFA